MKSLQALGWDVHYDSIWRALALGNCVPGRVIADYGSVYKVALPEEVSCEVSGKLQHVSARYEVPKVGDWVAVQKLDDRQGIIQEVLERRTEISRKQPGERNVKQVLAANVDIAFLVQALDFDFSPQRLQRYLFQLAKDGIKAIIVLNKADVAVDMDDKISELGQLKVEIVVTSAKEKAGLDSIESLIGPGKTAVLLGSSGVGKSTITNALLGEDRQATRDIRHADSKGRHTTSHRELFALPNGGLIIDTPGLRELQLWGTEDDLGAAFPDIEALAAQCKFKNCSHMTEPGCAVLEAKSSGILDAARLEDYFKFQKELRFLATQVEETAAQERKEHNKKIQKHFNQAIRSKKRIV